MTGFFSEVGSDPSGLTLRGMGQMMGGHCVTEEMVDREEIEAPELIKGGVGSEM